MTSEQNSNDKEQIPPAIGNTTNIDGDVHAPVLSGTFTGPVNVSTNQVPLQLLTLQQQRNRNTMLQKVKVIWINGLLKNSLAEVVKIELGLETHPDAVELPLNALVQELHHPPQVFPRGTPIVNVFDQMGGTLLILGAPGAGKTTLLLELARDLITRTEIDEAHPIPVVFNLTTWATSQKPLKHWLVEELNQRYDVPRKVAQQWIDQDGVLPLLDGLDEVAIERRNACVEAINTYRLQDGSLLPIAIRSRIGDYEALATK